MLHRTSKFFPKKHLISNLQYFTHLQVFWQTVMILTDFFSLKNWFLMMQVGLCFLTTSKKSEQTFQCHGNLHCIHAKTEGIHSEPNSLTCSSYIIKYWEIVALFGKLLLLWQINSQYNYVHVEQPKDG